MNIQFPSEGTALIDSDTVEGQEQSAIRRVRKVLMVHAGAFEASTGPIEFDEARLRRVERNMNAMRQILVEEYGGKAPDGAFPPILDGHLDERNSDVVGRLIGEFQFEIRDIPKVGKQIPCITSYAAFLGEETVKQVDDGRIYHLSVGIDDETDLMGELSTVVTPAAPGAMLLSKAKPAKPVHSSKKKAAPLERVAQLANNKTKGKLTMPSTPKKNAKLAAIKSLLASGDKLAKLSGEKKKEVTKLVATARVTGKLSALVKAGKMSPAEMRNAPLAKLAAASPEALELYASGFEGREPVIQVGQIGTRDAVDAATLGKQAKEAHFAKLKAEAKADVARKSGKKLSTLSGAEKKTSRLDIHSKVDAKLAAFGGEGETASLSDQIPKKSAELESGLDSDSPVEDYERHLTDQQTQIDAMSVQIAKMGDVIKKMVMETEAAEEAVEEAEEVVEESDAEMGGDSEDEESELASDEDEDSELGADEDKESKLAKDEDEDEESEEEKEKKRKAGLKKLGKKTAAKAKTSKK